MGICNEMVLSGPDNTVPGINSQQLWLYAQDLCKIKAAKNPAAAVGAGRPHEAPPLAEELLTIGGCWQSKSPLHQRGNPREATHVPVEVLCPNMDNMSELNDLSNKMHEVRREIGRKIGEGLKRRQWEWIWSKQVVCTHWALKQQTEAKQNQKTMVKQYANFNL